MKNQIEANIDLSSSIQILDDKIKGYEKKLSQLYEYWILIKLTEILAKITNTPEPLNKIFFDKKDKFNINMNLNKSYKLKDI